MSLRTLNGPLAAPGVKSKRAVQLCSPYCRPHAEIMRGATLRGGWLDRSTLGMFSILDLDWQSFEHILHAGTTEVKNLTKCLESGPSMARFSRGTYVYAPCLDRFA